MELTRKVLIVESESDLILDYNYYYELMKEIYSAMKISNIKRTEKLHNEGYKIDNKIYKLFTSQLFIENATYQANGIVIKKGTKLRLMISGAKITVEDAISGFIKKGNLKLFKNYFKIVDMENDKKINLNEITLYKVRNPIVASIQDENKKIVYVSPYQQEVYFKILANNLKRKYKLIYNKEYEGELYFDVEDIFSIKKKLISNIKTKGILIGYSGFELYIQASKEMQRVAYYCGVGSNNSLGMGLMTYIMSRRD
jgi:CRISPR-associated endoribonuclease Cas6